MLIRVLQSLLLCLLKEIIPVRSRHVALTMALKLSYMYVQERGW